MSATIDSHGHQDHTCKSCTAPHICDCPCESCISARLALATPAPATVAITAPKSWIQRALDDEWAAANFGGPGCPFCDAMFGCGCQARRSEMIEAEYRRQRLAAGCTCTDEDGYCDQRDDGHGYEEEEDDRTEYGDCSGCYPGCHGCQDDFDPADPWGDGAPEEHRDDDGAW